MYFEMRVAQLTIVAYLNLEMPFERSKLQGLGPFSRVESLTNGNSVGKTRSMQSSIRVKKSLDPLGEKFAPWKTENRLGSSASISGFSPREFGLPGPREGERNEQNGVWGA